MSPKSKESFHSKELKGKYDLIVIGGGIYGAALLWEATSRGLSSILLEKKDFGSGTSANSLKIIHGGLRYLQDMDIKRIRESSREQTVLMKIAPYLIYPLECVMPTYRGLSKNKYVLKAGLKVYDILTQNRNNRSDPAKSIRSGGIISKSELNSIFPYLQGDEITAGARWNDAQVYNSERLVMAFIKSATQMGADALNYVRAKDYIIKSDKMQGIIAQTDLLVEDLYIHSDMVVDCTGPWLKWNELNKKLIGSIKPVQYVKAINIVIPRKITNCAVGIKAASEEGEKTKNRLLFIAPWREGTILGTWYFCESNKNKISSVSKDQLETCVSEINSVLPELKLKLNDVSFIHCGLLPGELNYRGGKQPRLWNSPCVIDASKIASCKGLFLVQGVKYTTARAIAVRTVSEICKKMGKKVAPSRTDKMPLYGGNIQDYGSFSRSCHSEYSSVLDEFIIDRLILNYGTNTKQILNYVKNSSSLKEKVPGTDNTIKAELEFIMDNEMVFKLSDLVMRRTDMGSCSIPAKETISYCADYMAERLDWDSTTKQNNILELLENYPEWSRNSKEMNV